MAESLCPRLSTGGLDPLVGYVVGVVVEHGGTHVVSHGW